MPPVSKKNIEEMEAKVRHLKYYVTTAGKLKEFEKELDVAQRMLVSLKQNKRGTFGKLQRLLNHMLSDREIDHWRRNIQ